MAFKTAKQQYLDKYRGFKRVVRSDEFKCPELNNKDEWLNYVSTKYCESFCMGKGCKYLDECNAYQKAKYGTIEEEVV